MLWEDLNSESGMPRVPVRCLLLLTLAALASWGCGGGGSEGSDSPAQVSDTPAGPPGAQWDVVEMLRESAEREPHPSDRGGRAWLEQADEPPRAVVGTPGRFTIVYEVGPLGIATGGMIFFQVSPFWGWSTPQVEVPEAPGYTTVEPSSDDIEISAETLDIQLLGIRVTGRPLVAGDRIRIVYGAGPAGAAVDEYAEKNSRFWIGVDGDGDGTRAFLPDSPGIDVAAGPPAKLLVTLPTIARPGEVVRVAVAVLDAHGNAGPDFAGEIAFPDLPDGIEMPASVTFARGDGAAKAIEAVARKPGIYRLRATAGGGATATSNPMMVSETGPRVLWGDLQGHSALSDGTGTVQDYYEYARDVAALDVAALTDHDHWGILPLDAHPEIWKEIVEGARRYYEPGRFVTILGFEWTSWIHGHRHVLYSGDDGEVFSSIDPQYESPVQLWQALAGRSALTIAHHSAGGPIRVNWTIPPDPVFEPVTEIVSVHGSSEALDSPIPIYNPVPGNFVRDALDRGYRLGFIGSGDSHDGHPGLPQLAAASGGLAAILSEERTREGVFAALRARRVYATNGPRILLRTAFGSHGMGSVVSVPSGESVSDELFVHVLAPAPLDRVELIRSGEIVDGAATEGRLEVVLQRPVEALRAGEYLYVRAIQEDGGTAWSSPIFFE
jgi:hypothetical protein